MPAQPATRPPRFRRPHNGKLFFSTTYDCAGSSQTDTPRRPLGALVVFGTFLGVAGTFQLPG
jgi:hypothetical protein